MYKIQKNIPVPRVTRASVRKVYPFEDMRVGDCLLVPGKSPHQIQPHISKTGKELGYVFVTRKVYLRQTRGGPVICEANHPQAEAGVGVWRGQ